MIFTTEQIQQIFGTINYRLAQVVADVLGKDFLSEEDKSILSFYKFDWEKKYNELSPYWKIFLFGRVSALIPNSSILSLSKKDIDKYAALKQNKEISNRDILEYKAAAFRTYSHIKGIGDKIKASVSGSITSQELNLSVAQRRGDVLKEELKEGVLKKKAVQSIVSDIGGKLKEWDRDWGRIVETEMQDIYSLGKAQEIMEKSGVDALVFKDVYGGACKNCIRLYLTNGIGSKPIIFKLSKLIENGTNVGRKVKEWKATLGAVHSFCRCELRQIPDGYVWDDEKKSFVPSKVIERKVERRSKVKITVGDKTFEV